VTVLLETGMLPMREPVTSITLDTPAGPVPVEARCHDGKVERVQFTNVPCFVTHLGVKLDVEGLGPIPVDVAYGGAFFAIVDAPSLGFSVEPKEARDLVAVGNRIVAAAKQLSVRHPENPDIHGVTFAEFAMPFAGPGTVSRNAVIVAPGRIDRSPCGTGTSARLAVLHARRQLGPGQGFIHESIIGSRFDAAIAAEVTVAGRPGIVPTIAGQAWITGVFQHGVDPSDPFRNGFTLPDMWLAGGSP
jgi:proline racemase